MRHDHAMKLLPWLQQGRLSPDERRQVAAHVAGCRECDRELARVALLAEAVGAVDPAEPLPSPDLLARALARLPAQRAPHRAPAAWLAAVREGWTSFWGPLPTPARVALVVQFGLLLALGAAWIGARSPWQGGHPSGEMVTLGGDRPPVERGEPTEAPGSRLRLVVAFDEAASEQQLRQTLFEVGGTIVGGPSAAGFYTVELALGSGGGAQSEGLLARLRRSEVVRYAERAP